MTVATKRGLGVRRAGHAGTLDPFASGLLLVLVGRARRVQRFLMALPKEYVTDGAAGRALDDRRPGGRDHLDGAHPAGRSAMCPLASCASGRRSTRRSRVQGRKAYERARDGEDFEVPERDVTVYRFEQTARDGDERGEYLIECSAGTYVRSLIAELGDAYCEELRRTRIGPCARRGGRLPARARRSAEALAFLPVVRLDADAGWRAAHGQRVAGEVPEGAEHVLLVDDDGPVAIAEPGAGGGRAAEAHRRVPRVIVTPLAEVSPARAASPSARSTACISATARSSTAPTRC